MVFFTRPHQKCTLVLDDGCYWTFFSLRGRTKADAHGVDEMLFGQTEVQVEPTPPKILAAFTVFTWTHRAPLLCAQPATDNRYSKVCVYHDKAEVGGEGGTQ